MPKAYNLSVHIWNNLGHSNWVLFSLFKLIVILWFNLIIFQYIPIFPSASLITCSSQKWHIGPWKLLSLTSYYIAISGSIFMIKNNSRIVSRTLKRSLALHGFSGIDNYFQFPLLAWSSHILVCYASQSGQFYISSFHEVGLTDRSKCPCRIRPMIAETREWDAPKLEAKKVLSPPQLCLGKSQFLI